MSRDDAIAARDSHTSGERQVDGTLPCDECWQDWPCITRRLADALLAAAPPEPGLDEERLYRAMVNLDTEVPGLFNIVAISEPDTRPVAAVLAAEYARLREEPPA